MVGEISDKEACTAMKFGFEPYQATMYCYSQISLASILLSTAQAEPRNIQIEGYPSSCSCFPSVVYQSNHWLLIVMTLSAVRLRCDITVLYTHSLCPERSDIIQAAWSRPEVTVGRESACVSIFNASSFAYGFLIMLTQGMIWVARWTRWSPSIQTSMQSHNLRLIALTRWW